MSDANAVGLSEQQLFAIATEVSVHVNAYNADHPSEMLAKTPETVIEQFAAGYSCLVISKGNGEPHFLYHGSIYPLMERGEDRVIGMQVVELGTDITHERYRGLGLGTLGIKTRLEMVRQLALREQRPILGLATIKRMVTGHVYEKEQIAPISFWEVPYLSFLTDSCETTSERFGHTCSFRRERGDTPEGFSSRSENLYIPCTLLATDHALAYQFDQRVRELDLRYTGEVIPPGVITPQAYAHIASVYDILATQGSA
jgi:hypothetical protein